MSIRRSRRGKRFLLYVPGLISLCLFFPLTLSQLNQLAASKKFYAMEVNWYSPELNRPYGLQFPPVRQYQVLTMTGNKEDDEAKLDLMQTVLREMLAMNDTINGLRIHFTDTARYESLVHALEICNLEGGVTYLPYENDLWIITMNRTSALQHCLPISYGMCGTIGALRLIKNGNVPFSFRYDYDARFWPILLLLVFLTLLSFRKTH